MGQYILSNLRILLGFVFWKCSDFGAKKIHSYFQFQFYWQFYMEERDDDLLIFLKIFCAPIIMALLVPGH